MAEKACKRELPDALDWPERTREWWQAWVDSPVTDEFTDLQWEYLLDTALLHATVWGSGDVSKAGELRTRVERLGGIPAPPKAGPPPAPAQQRETPLDELAKRRAAGLSGAKASRRPAR